jgi:tryptophanyl-tRNA synthetase
MLIPGTNGGKMSKSANNIINIFLWHRKQVMSIEARHWKIRKIQTCNAFAIYKLLATEDQLSNMTTNYLWKLRLWSRKQALFELIWNIQNRKRKIQYYLNNLEK